MHLLFSPPFSVSLPKNVRLDRKSPCLEELLIAANHTPSDCLLLDAHEKGTREVHRLKNII